MYRLRFAYRDPERVRPPPDVVSGRSASRFKTLFRLIIYEGTGGNVHVIYLMISHCVKVFTALFRCHLPPRFSQPLSVCGFVCCFVSLKC